MVGINWPIKRQADRCRGENFVSLVKRNGLQGKKEILGVNIAERLEVGVRQLALSALVQHESEIGISLSKDLRQFPRIDFVINHACMQSDVGKTLLINNQLLSKVVFTIDKVTWLRG